ncbi:MAG: response regulator, partial [Spirochaetales bacterium]|nr:response regulator [Spirochaetales bacterium]
MFHVALVDDEKDLLFSLQILLKAEGWKVSVYYSAESAYSGILKDTPDTVILDMMLPGKDGLWLCREVRKLYPQLPLIFLSARDEELDRIVGLE